MITSVSVARFYWMPLVWMFVVFLSLLIVALICNIFDSRAENEIEMRDRSSFLTRFEPMNPAAPVTSTFIPLSIITMKGRYLSDL